MAVLGRSRSGAPPLIKSWIRPCSSVINENLSCKMLINKFTYRPIFFFCYFILGNTFKMNHIYKSSISKKSMDKTSDLKIYLVQVSV